MDSDIWLRSLTISEGISTDPTIIPKKLNASPTICGGITSWGMMASIIIQETRPKATDNRPPNGVAFDQ